MNDSLKQLLVIFGASALIFGLIKPRGDGSKSNSFFGKSKPNRIPIRMPNIEEEYLQDDDIRNAYEALCAYIDSYNDGESDDILDKIKSDFSDKMGLVIYETSSGKLAVRDNNGNDILTNN